jgi:hypothetical protein
LKVALKLKGDGLVTPATPVVVVVEEEEDAVDDELEEEAAPNAKPPNPFALPVLFGPKENV